MRPLSAIEITRIWERGRDLHPLDKGLLILSFACPNKDYEELAAFTLGQRDAILFKLRALSFGDQLVGSISCPECGNEMRFTVNTEDLLRANNREPIGKDLKHQVGDYEISYRLPNTYDLASAMRCGDADEASRRLMQRCVLKSTLNKAAVTVESLPQELNTVLGSQIAKHDPLVDIELDLTCPVCAWRWPTTLDILSFFWSEISVQARHLLCTVHTLARAYGWREQDILSMSTHRREFYIGMITQ